jgi:asparagine synthase (glutamine-hydrolysing)
MCGIAGIAMAPGAPPPDPAVLRRMTEALHHRGPDGHGATAHGQIALAHTRLAIIDLATGDQPFFAHAHRQDAALIANGEIYNFSELRAAMAGTAFTSQGDCEPALHLYLADPDHYAARLRGMYAIAIDNRTADTLTLTRDPFGIKPLYITQLANGIAFASEPQALLAAGLARRAVRQDARAALLNMQFSPGADTIFPDITRVLPGQTLTIARGRIAGSTVQAPLPPCGAETITEDAALLRLDAALMDSVALHLRSDVPYGMFLSGGIDSAAILACMARLDSRPLAFTAGFDVPGAADERAQAAAMARAVGARHEAIDITEADMLRHLPEIVACMDDPAADYAIIPTWFLARRARQDVKVVLSGEGGDEMFAGYGRYRRAIRPWWRGGRSMRARGTFEGLGVLRHDMSGWRAGLSAIEAGLPQGATALQAAQAADIAGWLPDDLLIKLDRCLMAHAVEGRTPFLDPGVAAAAWNLPGGLKLRDRQGKYLLRAWLAGALPAARPFAPKQGFTVPVGAWIAKHGRHLGGLVANQPGIAEIADPAAVTRLFAAASGRREGAAAWSLLFYAVWHRAHIEARPTGGNVFDFLAAP